VNIALSKIGLPTLPSFQKKTSPYFQSFTQKLLQNTLPIKLIRGSLQSPSKHIVLKLLKFSYEIIIPYIVIVLFPLKDTVTNFIELEQLLKTLKASPESSNLFFCPSF
jgi:hypothetical protein